MEDWRSALRTNRIVAYGGVRSDGARLALPSSMEPQARSTKAPPHATSPVKIEVTTRTMIIAALVVFGAWIAIRLAPVALVLVVALFLVGTLDPIVEWLAARRVKRELGIGFVFASTLVTGVAL